MEILDKRLFRIRDLMKYLSVSRSTIYRLMKTENFPKRVKIPATNIYAWEKEEIQKWVETGIEKGQVE
jgi:predicted DNA-binding transcriptional regulator AlpA